MTRREGNAYTDGVIKSCIHVTLFVLTVHLRELVGIRTFDLLLRSVGVFGVTGLDKLYCFMIVKELQAFVGNVRQLIDKNMTKFLGDFTQELTPTSIIPMNTIKLYTTAMNSLAKLWPVFLSTSGPCCCCCCCIPCLFV